MSNNIGIVKSSFCYQMGDNCFVWQYWKIGKGLELIVSWNLNRDFKLVIFSSSDPFAFVLSFVLVRTHFFSYKRIFLSLFPCKNSLVRKSGSELLSPLINSISKSKADKIAYHLAKICLETRFLTSICKISFADLQSMRRRNFL